MIKSSLQLYIYTIWNWNTIFLPQPALLMEPFADGSILPAGLRRNDLKGQRLDRQTESETQNLPAVIQAGKQG